MIATGDSSGFCTGSLEIEGRYIMSLKARGSSSMDSFSWISLFLLAAPLVIGAKILARRHLRITSSVSSYTHDPFDCIRSRDMQILTEILKIASDSSTVPFSIDLSTKVPEQVFASQLVIDACPPTCWRFPRKCWQFLRNEEWAGPDLNRRPRDFCLCTYQSRALNASLGFERSMLSYRPTTNASKEFKLLFLMFCFIPTNKTLTRQRAIPEYWFIRFD